MPSSLPAPMGNARDTRRSTLAVLGSLKVLRSMFGSRLVPPTPRMPVRTRLACGAFPETIAVNGAPDDTAMMGAIVKLSSQALDDLGCHTVLKLNRCGMSKLEIPSSRPRSNGLSTLLAAVKVCDDWPLSFAFE